MRLVPDQTDPGDAIRVGDLTLDLASQSVRVGPRTVTLSTIEFQIMLALAETPGAVVDSEALQKRLWGTATPEGAAGLRVHMNRIRGRIEPARSDPRFLKTVRGRGYMLLSGPAQP